MPSTQTRIVQDDFSSGIVRDVARHLIPEDGAYDIVNGILSEDGSITRRGGTLYKSNAAFPSSLRFVWAGETKVGERTVLAGSGSFGVLGADGATPINLGGAGLTYPKSAVMLDGILFIGGGVMYAGSRKTSGYSTGTVDVTNGSAVVTGTGTAFLANVDPGMMFQIGTGRVYVVKSVDSNTQLTLADAYAGATAAGQAYALTAIRTIAASDPYPISDYYAVVASRLVADVGGIVRFSEVDNPHSYTNKFNTTNEHPLPEGALILGFGVVGLSCLIFTTVGLWGLDGLAYDIVDADGNPQHALHELSRDLILFGDAGVAEWHQGVVAPCVDGVYLLDGVSAPELISRSIEPLYLSYTRGTFRPGGAAVAQDHYLLPILDASGTVEDLLVCRLLRPQPTGGKRHVVYPWTRLAGTGVNVAALALRQNDQPTPADLFGANVGDGRVHDCSFVLNPSSAVPADADGVAHTMVVVTRDFMTGKNTLNRFRKLRATYVLTDTGAGPQVAFSWGDGFDQGQGGRWGQLWGQFNWTKSLVAMTPLFPWRPASNGIDPCAYYRINRSRRQVRVEIKNRGACGDFILRRIELVISPSKAERR